MSRHVTNACWWAINYGLLIQARLLAARFKLAAKAAHPIWTPGIGRLMPDRGALGSLSRIRNLKANLTVVWLTPAFLPFR